MDGLGEAKSLINKFNELKRPECLIVDPHLGINNFIMALNLDDIIYGKNKQNYDKVFLPKDPPIF
jgi:hypothetical protein